MKPILKPALFSTCLLIMSQQMAIAGGKPASNPAPPPAPSYMTNDDFVNALYQKRYDFSFATSDKPSDAKLAIEPYPRASCPAYTSAGYRIQGAGTVGLNWTTELAGKVQKGYIMFQRSNGAPHRYMCSVTHVGLVWNPTTGDILESQPPDPNKDPRSGVYIREYWRFWSEQAMWSARKLKYKGDWEHASATDKAWQQWAYIPYWPKIQKGTDYVRALKPWLDKNDFSSMMCSKLVYQTYRQFSGVNLDSNRSFTTEASWQDWTDPVRWAAQGMPSIAVTPDDIYYSEQLGPDIAYNAIPNWAHTYN